MTADTSPDKQDMVLAVGYETARESVRSGGLVHSAEIADIARRFPKELMERRGLMLNGALTGHFGLSYNLAQAKLRSLMTSSEKMEMAQALFEICSADDSVDPGEITIIIRAMAVLGVSKADLADYMRIRIQASTIPPAMP